MGVRCSDIYWDAKCVVRARLVFGGQLMGSMLREGNKSNSYNIDICLCAKI